METVGHTMPCTVQFMTRLPLFSTPTLDRFSTGQGFSIIKHDSLFLGAVGLLIIVISFKSESANSRFQILISFPPMFVVEAVL